MSTAQERLPAGSRRSTLPATAERSRALKRLGQRVATNKAPDPFLAFSESDARPSQLELLVASQVPGDQDGSECDREIGGGQSLSGLGSRLELPDSLRDVGGAVVLDLDRHDQVRLREKQEVALGLCRSQRRSGSVEVDDDEWMRSICHRHTAFPPFDAVNQARAVGDPGPDPVRKAAHSASPRGSAIFAQSLCRAAATASNPDG